jgi:hypothetical protein
LKRTDDVFFFTLVDFLLQAFFFGMLLYVLNAVDRESAAQNKAADEQILRDILISAGVSNLTQLHDMLTRLQPVDQLRGWADFLSRNGGERNVESAVLVVTKSGGSEKVAQDLERLRKLDETSGKPPCVYDVGAGGKKAPRGIATVVVNDSTIHFQGNTPELREVLTLLGTGYEAVSQLKLVDFRRVFGALPAKRPECRYYVRVIEETQLVMARDAVEAGFLRLPVGLKNAESRPAP